MSEVNEKATARDATNWAKKVSTLNVSEVPEGAVAINPDEDSAVRGAEGSRDA